MEPSARDGVESAGLGRVWLGLFLASTPWMIDLVLSLMYTRTAVATGRKAMFFVIAAGSLAITLVGLTLSHRSWHALSRASGERETEAARSLAVWGMGFGVFSLLLIAAMTLSSLVYGPRDLP